MSTYVIPLAVALVVVALLVTGFAIARRGRGGTSGPDLPPAPGGSGERTSKVRVLPSPENARRARTKALTDEMESLRREAEYAQQRGLERRAERLRAMIADRRRQLEARRSDPDRPAG